MNTEKKEISLLALLRQKVGNHIYNYRYQEITNDGVKNVYIAVINEFDDLAFILHYRTDLLYLVNCVPVYNTRVDSRLLNKFETIFDDICRKEVK